MRNISLITTLALGLFSLGASAQHKPKIAPNYGKLPLSFEMNVGQTNKRVNFLSRGAGYSLFLTPNEAVFSLSRPQAKGKKCAVVPPSVLRMKLLGANANPKSVGEAQLPGKVNYLKGNDPKQWRTNISTYGKVRYQSVYQGIDQVFYGNQRKLEYDFVVAPHADYKQIGMEFAGAKSIQLLKNGDLKLSLKGGSVVWQAPLVVC